MNSTKLTIKDSSLSFLLGFLLCQLGVVVSTCITLFIYKFCGLDIALFESFSTSGVGYLISALSLYLVMLMVFFYFNHKKENVITSKTEVVKLFKYILLAIISFLTLYPIVTCFDSLLVKVGAKINTLPYELNTKNYFLSLISLVITPAICEELLFRGVIFRGLRKYGKSFSILSSSIMFCLFHMAISQTIYPILMGLLLAVIMYYENNIYYCIAVHMTNNFLSLTLSYFKIGLIFQHWTYILLAIVLGAIFLSIVLTLTIKNNKTSEKQALTKQDKLYFIVTMVIMLLIWGAVNFI